MESPTMRRLDAAEQEFTGEGMRRIETEGKTSDFIGGFEWTSFFRFIDGEPLPEAYPWNTYPVMEDRAKQALRTYGSMGTRNMFDISPSKLLAPLKKDKHGPRDISDDQLMRVLTDGNPPIHDIVERLVVMGFGDEAAMKTATGFHELRNSSIIGDSVASFSVNDGLLQTFNWNKEDVAKIVSVDSTGDRERS